MTSGFPAVRACSAFVLLASAPLAVAAPPGPVDPPADVAQIDLEDLLKMRVTSPSRKEQSLTDVSAAVYVIREDDLKRTGARSLSEALRGVPGVQIGRFRSHAWAITARGFSDGLANKMLVLIDGRSVYSPLHSGVFWDVQDTFLEDVERIEVIRGPGGTLWGANAINGVINVITRSAKGTRGGFLGGGFGTEERGFAEARYGFTAGTAAVRIYAKGFVRDDAADGLDPDRDAHDDWSTARAGFRSDWKRGDHDDLTIMGDYYDGSEEAQVTSPLLTPPFLETFVDRTDLSGGNLIFRWERSSDAQSSLSLQAYYDYTSRTHPRFGDTIHTGDIDFQHRFSAHRRHDINWGLDLRYYHVDVDGSIVLDIVPDTRGDYVASAFVQDEIALAGERLHLVLGSKFEHNDYSGFEAQPSARLAWKAAERHLLWAAVSRAVRTPSIIDVDGRLTPQVLPTAPPTAVSIFGSDDFQSEELLAYEAGYRARPAERFSLDLAAFRNRYHDLRSGEVGLPFVETTPPPLHVVVPVSLANGLHGWTWGAELAMNLQAASWWLVQASYAYLWMDVSEEAVNRREPRNQAWLRSAMDLPGQLSLDLVGRYVGELRAFALDSYLEADVRLAWKHPERGLEVAVVGQNLLHDSHPEFNDAASRSEIQRGAYLSLAWRFRGPQ